jgi:ATP-dependent Clp protease ATP-binding subunit ClpC
MNPDDYDYYYEEDDEDYDEDEACDDSETAEAESEIQSPQKDAWSFSVDRQRLLNLESELKEKIIGQDAAISAICRAIRRGEAGFRDPMRPVGSFVFLGPSGVGKTELCRVLAEILYGNKNRLIKLDMSEYMAKHEASKLTGAAPGYTGYETGGRLTNLIKQHPHSVLCIDEMEKAHPDIFDLFLQILEDGVLTSSQGEVISFANVLIIMTSNLGAKEFNSKIGFAADNNAERVKEAEKHMVSTLKTTFRPEFLGRIDDVIIFNKLSEREVLTVCKNMLKTVIFRAKILGIKLDFDKTSIAELVKLGYNEEYGVRPLRRVISGKIEDVLADRVLSGELNPGDDIQVKFGKKGFVIAKKRIAYTMTKSAAV